MITHHVEELPPATSHVLLLDDGRPSAPARPGTVLRAEVLSRAYGCDVSVRCSSGRFYLEVYPSSWERLIER